VSLLGGESITQRRKRNITAESTQERPAKEGDRASKSTVGAQSTSGGPGGKKLYCRALSIKQHYGRALHLGGDRETGVGKRKPNFRKLKEWQDLRRRPHQKLGGSKVCRSAAAETAVRGSLARIANGEANHWGELGGCAEGSIPLKKYGDR